MKIYTIIKYKNFFFIIYFSRIKAQVKYLFIKFYK